MKLSKELTLPKDQYSEKILMEQSVDMQLNKTSSIGQMPLLVLHLIMILESKKELKKTTLMVPVQYFLTLVISQVQEGSLSMPPSSTL